MEKEPTQMILHQIVHLTGHLAMSMLGKYDLKPWQAGILFTLSKQSGLSQRELAKITRVTPPTMTVAIKKMEKQGYITRVQDEKDQRIIRLFITEKGETCIADAKEVFGDLEEVIMTDINEEERHILSRLLLQMRDNLSKNTQNLPDGFCPHDLN